MSEQGIKVAIRVRPINEAQDKAFKCDPTSSCVYPLSAEGVPLENQVYSYDNVFDETSKTVDVYRQVGEEIVNGVMRGINGTIFAYGQTSSGKTHTMLGKANEKGILEMAADDIFRFIQENNHLNFILRASFVEIYNEDIKDLLSDKPSDKPTIREDRTRGVYCTASEHFITDVTSIKTLIQVGISHRSVEATAMNETSSRSHSIFRLVVESQNKEDESVLVASLNLVDLAGSESVRNTGASGQRAKEGGKINQSLLSLSRVIQALGEQQAQQKTVHVNFRDSKLTRLLQPSLSGNAKMSIICCITPDRRYAEETKGTLQFAGRAKLVKTRATVNEFVDERVMQKRLINSLQEEVTNLKMILAQHGISDPEGLESQVVQQLKDALEEKKILIEQMEYALVEKENQYLEVQNGMYELELETRRNQDDMANLREQHSAEIASLREERSYFITELEARQQGMIALQQEINAVKNALSNKELELASSQESYLQATSMYEDHKLNLEIKVQELEISLLEKDAKFSEQLELNSKKDSVIDDLDKLVKEYEVELQRMKEHCDSEIQRTKDELKSLRDKLYVQENENDELRLTAASNEKLVQEMKTTIRDLEMEKEQLESELRIKEEDTRTLTIERNQTIEEIESLREDRSTFVADLESKENTIAALEAEVSKLSEASSKMQHQIETLSFELETKDSELQRTLSSINGREEQFIELENQFFELNQEFSSARASMKEETEALIQPLRKELEDKNRRIEELQSAIVMKDQRIQQLDAVKLTKAQMEKIKLIKEERKKFHDDAKILKAQLQQLKNAYDTLKESKSDIVSNPSQDFVISDLRFQIVEINGQLKQCNSLNQLLKEKLKECSSQLEEYEKERDQIILTLEKLGIPSSTLLAATVDTSTLSSDDAHNSSSSLNHSNSEAADISSTHLYVALVKYFEEKLAAAKSEQLRLEEAMAELKKKMELQEMNSELSLLQEENIELHQENKDLLIKNNQMKNEILSLKKKLIEPNSTTTTNTKTHVAATPLTTTPSSNLDNALLPKETQIIGVKRSFGQEIDQNVVSSTVNSSAAKELKPAVVGSAKKPLLPKPSSSDDIENNERLAPAPSGKSTKRQRVKASAVSASGGTSEETPGECTQS